MRLHLFRPARQQFCRLRTTVWTRLKQLLLVLCGFGIRVKVIGLDRVALPLKRSHVVAANHLNGADSIVLLVALRTRLFFATALRWFAGRFRRFIMEELCDAIPLEPGKPIASLAGVRDCIRTLQSGGCIGIYPEGQFTPDGRIREVYDGAAYLAVRSGAPILPVHIRNLRTEQKVDATTVSTEAWTGFLTVVEQLFNTDIEVVLGDPILPGSRAPGNRAELRAEVERINARLMHEFDALASQYP